MPDSAAALNLATARTKWWRPRSRLLTLGAAGIHLIDEGAAADWPSVVVLPAQWLSAFSLDSFAGHIADKTQVVRLDLPGHGLSGPMLDGDYSATAYAALISAAIAALDLPRYVLVAPSFSAIPAALFAGTAPAGLAGLALVTASGLPRDGGPAPNLPPPPHLAPGADGRHRRDFYRWKLSTLLRRDHPASRIEALIDDLDNFNELPGRAREARARVQAHDPAVMAGALRRVGVPVLVQWSSDSLYLPPAMAETMAALAPRARPVHHYPQTGHLLLPDAPAETAADLCRFLETLA